MVVLCGSLGAMQLRFAVMRGGGISMLTLLAGWRVARLGAQVLQLPCIQCICGGGTACMLISDVVPAGIQLDFCMLQQ